MSWHAVGTVTVVSRGSSAGYRVLCGCTFLLGAGNAELCLEFMWLLRQMITPINIRVSFSIYSVVTSVSSSLIFSKLLLLGDLVHLQVIRGKVAIYY